MGPVTIRPKTSDATYGLGWVLEKRAKDGSWQATHWLVPSCYAAGEPSVGSISEPTMLPAIRLGGTRSGVFALPPDLAAGDYRVGTTIIGSRGERREARVVLKVECR